MKSIAQNSAASNDMAGPITPTEEDWVQNKKSSNDLFFKCSWWRNFPGKLTKEKVAMGQNNTFIKIEGNKETFDKDTAFK